MKRAGDRLKKKFDERLALVEWLEQARGQAASLTTERIALMETVSLQTGEVDLARFLSAAAETRAAIEELHAEEALAETKRLREMIFQERASQLQDRSALRPNTAGAEHPADVGVTGQCRVPEAESKRQPGTDARGCHDPRHLRILAEPTLQISAFALLREPFGHDAPHDSKILAR